MKVFKKQIDILSLAICILGIAYIIITIAALVWGCVGSFMPSRVFDYEPTKIPNKLVIDNYEKVWKEFYVIVTKKHRTYWLEDLFFNGFML